MEKKLTLLLVPAALAVAFTGITFMSPAAAVQSQRGECEQNCTRTYQECRRAANSNQAACKQALDACREGCKDVRPHESPTPSPSPTPTATPTPTPTASLPL